MRSSERVSEGQRRGSETMEGWNYSVLKLLLRYLNLVSFYSLFYPFFCIISFSDTGSRLE